MPAWGESETATNEYRALVAWYNEMRKKFALPVPTGVSRMKRHFWVCYIATKADDPFHRLDELEAGLAFYKKSGLTMPTFQRLITKNSSGAYGVENLLSYGSLNKLKPTTPEKTLSPQEIAARKAKQKMLEDW